MIHALLGSKTLLSSLTGFHIWKVSFVWIVAKKFSILENLIFPKNNGLKYHSVRLLSRIKIIKKFKLGSKLSSMPLISEKTVHGFQFYNFLDNERDLKVVFYYSNSYKNRQWLGQNKQIENYGWNAK